MMLLDKLKNAVYDVNEETAKTESSQENILNQKKRITWIDICKGIGIILVVVMNAQRGNQSRTHQCPCHHCPQDGITIVEQIVGRITFTASPQSRRAVA